MKDRLSIFLSLFSNNWKNKVVISQLLNVVIGLIIGKIIAIEFSPESFGRYNLEFGFITFFYSLLLSPFVQYCKLYYRNLVERIGYSYFIKLSVILLILTVFLFSTVFKFYNSDYSIQVIIVFSVLYLMLNSLNAISQDFLNLNNNQKKFLKLTIFKTVLSLTVLILLIYFWRINNEVLVLWILQLSGLLGGAVFIFELFRNQVFVKKKLNLKTFFQHYFKYSWPLMILAFWNWISSYFDRYILDFYLTESAVGLYNANFSLGSKFFLLIYPFFLLKLTPEIYNEKSIELIKSRINRYVNFYILISVVLLVLLFLFQRLIGAIFLSQQYSTYFMLIFLSGIGFFVLTLTYFYESIFYLKKALKYILYATIIGAIVSVVLNIILIPKFSVYGAAYSFILATLVKLIYIKMNFEKI